MALQFADLWRWGGRVNGKTYAIVGIVGVAIKHVDDMLYRHTHDADDRVCLPVDSATPAPQIRKLQRHTLSLSASLCLLCPNAANSVLNPFLAFFQRAP